MATPNPKIELINATCGENLEHNTPANGVVTIGPIANANGAANGDAGHVRILSGNNVIAEGDCGTGANTVVFDNVNIAVDQVVAISSANFTIPSGA